jgi:hypothetical protein
MASAYESEVPIVKAETFGSCETCGEVREGVLEDGDLVLKCANGHRSDLS